MTVALQAHHLTKRYGALVACDQVSLSVLPGEIHALIGPNGAGKSTLIHLLSGTIAPDAGKLLMGDRDGHERKRSIARITDPRTSRTTAVQRPR